MWDDFQFRWHRNSYLLYPFSKRQQLWVCIGCKKDFFLFCNPTVVTVAHLAPLSMEFSRQEYWRGLPCPSPGDLPVPGIEPRSPALQADALTSEPPGKLIQWRFLTNAGKDGYVH